MPGKLTPKSLLLPVLFAVSVAGAAIMLHSAGENAYSVQWYAIFYALLGGIVTFLYFSLPSQAPNRNSFLLVLLTGLLIRLLFFSSGPVTSNDHYRYVWEGKLLVNGYSPYYYAPGDSALTPLAENGFPEKVAFKKLQSLYPPLAQAFFALSYIAGGLSITGLKIISLLCEGLTLWLLYLLLLRYNMPVKNLLLYAWFPLPVFEFFINNHIDAAGIPFLLGALLLYEKEKLLPSAVLFAGAVLVKLTPLFLLPVFFFGIKNNTDRIKFTVTVFMVIAAAYLPFLLAHNGMGSGLFTYMQKWEFNGAVYSFFKFSGLPQSMVRILLYLLLGSGMLALALSRFPLYKKLFYGYVLIILTATTAYPWYFSWINIFAVFNPGAAALYILNAVNASNITPYLFQLVGVWKEYTAVLLIQYVPFVVLLLYSVRKDYITYHRHSQSGSNKEGI